MDEQLVQYCVAEESYIEFNAQMRYNFRDDNLSSFSSTCALPVKEGWLKKKSACRFVGFQNRYFRLRDKRLQYFKKENCKQHLGIINFNLVSVDLEHFGRLIVLRPLCSKRRFVLASDTLEDSEDWIRVLKLHIIRSDGSLMHIPVPVSEKQWWRFDTITERQFSSIATTGDILLFHNRSKLSILTRVLINSNYDHVAMVLRYSSGRILLFEATQGSGVTLLDWEDYVQQKSYQGVFKVAYRHLEVELTDEMLKGLEDFIGGVEGKSYFLSAKQIVSKSTDESSGYFCSQLVASAYKSMGLISQETPSCTFWPGDFSLANDLQLNHGAYLAEEQMIDFEKEADLFTM
mmetsp:Transcript_935/g.2208  ORF Transcript_935/g.2208 Transcript_935/m.2208 type:complete len:347 (+) Transcript_935:2967-4007(+)